MFYRLGKNRRDVTEKEREQTKRVVYSVMYGAGTIKTSHILGEIKFQCCRRCKVGFSMCLVSTTFVLVVPLTSGLQANIGQAVSGRYSCSRAGYVCQVASPMSSDFYRPITILTTSDHFCIFIHKNVFNKSHPEYSDIATELLWQMFLSKIFNRAGRI